MTQTSFSVGSQTDLNNAIETIDSTATPGTYSITLTSNITETDATGGLYALSLAPGVVVDLDGANHTISGEAFNEAFFGGLAVTTGTVSISDLTLKDTLARGGAGGDGGGGGAGLGGGLFVGPDAKVSLSSVMFVDDAAQGGAGGSAGTGEGGAGGHSSLIYPALGGGGTAGVAGLPGTSSDTPGGDGSDGQGAGLGVAGGDGGDGGKGFTPGTDAFGEAGSDGGNGGKGGLGGIGGDGGHGGAGGNGGSGVAPIDPPWDGGDAGNGGDGGDAGDGGYGAGGGGGARAGNGGRGATGLSDPMGGPNGMASDGGDGGDGSKGGDGGFGGGGGAGAAGGTGGGGGTGQGVDGANGGAGGKGGDGGNGDFGAGGAGGGPGGNGGRAGPTNAGVGSPGSAGAGGSGGQAGLGGFGGGKGAAGSNGFAGPSSEATQIPGHAFGGAGGGGLGAGGAIFVADGGQLTVDGGLITGGTVVGGAAGGPGAGQGSFYGSGMFIDGDTTVSLAAPTGTTITISNVIADEQASGGIGQGKLSIGAGGTVDLDATNTFTGGITIKGGTLELSAPAAAGSGQITFDASGDPTLLFPSTAAPSNPIAALGLGDFIGVTDKTLSGDQYTGTGAPGGSLVLDFAGGGSVTLDIVGNYKRADFPIVDNQVAVTCFLAGTAILGPAGEVAVEQLRVGDMVMTQTDDGPRPETVRWIGHRRIDPARHPRPCDVLPVRVRRGAFGNGLPRRDLFLSPNHAVFVDEVLIPVRCLIDGAGVRQMSSAGRITYFHIELDCHSVVLAEGLPCESYLETGSRRMFENGGVPVALHADFTALAWDALGYAPLVVTGPKLLAVRSRLDCLRSGACETVEEPITARRGAL
jgi:collagen type I/II/III/V/XI/XXIV/XXVII alpha